MNILEQLQETLKKEIAKAVVAAGLATADNVPAVVLETPKDKAHGDLATNMAMQLTRIARRNPREIASLLVAHIDQQAASIENIEIAGPGFINFFLQKSVLTEVVSTVLTQGDAYGQSAHGGGERVNVEFVSANPTGHLHLGHARGAAIGDSLCNILEAAGYDVGREYYINDAGNQMDMLALSVEARYLQALGRDKELPADGYHGQEIVALGQEIASEYGDRFVNVSEEERRDFFREYGLKRELAKIKADLKRYGVAFDKWFSETSLYTSGDVQETLDELRELGHLYEQDGATWLKTTAFGDDKDRVLVKSDGSYTYLTPDIAYHRNKYARGFTRLINIWGADHHGYIPRMKAAMEAFDYRPEQLQVIVTQMVRLYKDGAEVKMSKRTGKAVTLEELMDEVGVDAARYFFAMRSSDTHLDFDMDLAVSKSTDNPVYYVQYAHARIHSVLRQAREKGIDVTRDEQVLPRLVHERESELLMKIGDFPQEVAVAAEQLAPHRVVNYLFDLATLLHSYYNAERVLSDDAELTRARLHLLQAVATVIKNGLALIGVSAPERM
ncbi:arginine--tRNA ligase [Numidum massiliense]|uniref:arginine--tRNA ligase n=1 Tax=Numidum massiliense TaxID=1522315 RepID=UPI0006D52B35|nr:arginine--tRNA ligase [Numidum massiliense]